MPCFIALNQMVFFHKSYFSCSSWRLQYQTHTVVNHT